MRRLRTHKIAAVLLAAALLVTGTAIAAEPDSSPEPDPDRLRATLAGREIALSEVVRHHCHDKHFPEVRCFGTEAESLADQGLDAQPIKPGAGDDFESAEVGSAATSTLYTIFYADWLYGGASYAAYGNISDLASIGWNNAITSFRLYNGARPRWYQGSFYAGSYACWTSDQSWLTGTWNDSISSVEAARFAC